MLGCQKNGNPTYEAMQFFKLKKVLREFLWNVGFWAKISTPGRRCIF